MLRSAVILAVCAFSVQSYVVNPGPTYVATKGEIWPKPQYQNISEDYYVITPGNFKFIATDATCTLLDNAFQRYFKILQQNTLHSTKTSHINNLKDDGLGVLSQLSVSLNGSCDDLAYPTIDMVESYTLTVQNGSAQLTSTSIWGVLRGLESFSQLVYLGNDRASIRINSTSIIDFPRFKHRGLLLDTSRHYQPLKQIFQIIDGLACNKMNVFHWHIVDDQSFPYVSKQFPELSAQGAYDPEFYVYNSTDIQEVIEYARQRGVRVMPEIDTPGHTRSWGVSHPELLTNCDAVQEGSMGPMDPTKNTTYSFMGELLAEIKDVFKDEFIHLGGDEVDFDCWASDNNITDFMEANDIDSYEELEGYFIQKIINIADGLSFKSIVWEEVFKNGVNLPNDTIVHVWRDWTGTLWPDTMNDVTRAGKGAILSACWYLDHLSSGGDWNQFYQCEPTNFTGTAEQKNLILGGEACMWAEVVNEYNVVQRIWPRASAPAEKLWSAEAPYNLEATAKRLEEHVCRMNRRGIPAQPPTASGFCL